MVTPPSRKNALPYAITQRMVKLAEAGTALATQRILRWANKTARFSKDVVTFVQTVEVPRELVVGYLAFTVFIVVLSATLFALVEIRVESITLGYEIARIEKEKQKLQECLRCLETERTRLMAPECLLRLNQSMGLYLLPPEDWLQRK